MAGHRSWCRLADTLPTLAWSLDRHLCDLWAEPMRARHLAPASQAMPRTVCTAASRPSPPLKLEGLGSGPVGVPMMYHFVWRRAPRVDNDTKSCPSTLNCRVVVNRKPLLPSKPATRNSVADIYTKCSVPSMSSSCSSGSATASKPSCAALMRLTCPSAGSNDYVRRPHDRELMNISTRGCWR